NIFGSRFRKRSPENIIEEIDILVKKYKVRQIDILDDNFTLDIGWAEQVLDLIIGRKYNLYITFPNGLRADRLNRDLVHKMKLAGVYKGGIGIETGDKKVMRLIKKNLDLDKVVQAIKWLRKEKITVFGFFMLGLPGETRSTMKKTIDFAVRSNPHIANFAVTIPMPGTELYEIIKKKGRFIKDNSSNLSRGYYTIDSGYYELGGLKSRDIKRCQRKAYISFYFRPSKVFEFFSLIRSWRELRWTITTALPLVQSIFKKN
ncbi:radical SAM protein, partial [Candidatus Woesearchaeota archaeon]|nr:radical SAM protein [Candidatus Woesearchaeota archaeon]